MSEERTIGPDHNAAPDYAATITATLEKDYAEVAATAAALLEESRALPKVIGVEDHEALGATATMIKRMRDTTARLETFRVTEKEPHLRGEQAVDSYFFGWIEKLARRNNKAKPGAADILQARVNDVNTRKADIERRRLEEVARLAREEAARLQREEDEARRKSEESRLAAERARKPENIDQHERISEHHAAVANETQIDARLAAMKANEAAAATVVKTSDLVRTRFDGGAMVTSRQVPVVEIIDRNLLSKELLWPFLKEEHILMALKAWAKTASHKTPMDGATIKLVDEAVVR